MRENEIMQFHGWVTLTESGQWWRSRTYGGGDGGGGGGVEWSGGVRL